MTDKKDGPGQKDGSAKAGERAGSDSAAKRPFATIDLKAVEVPADARKSGGPVPPKAAEPPNPRAPSPAMPKGQAEAAAKVAAASASQGAAAKPAGSPSASAAPGASPRPADAASAGAGKTSATSATSAAGSAVKSANAPPPSAAAGARRAGGGFGSHLLSGLIGGAVALLLGPLFAPQVDRMWEEIGVSASPPPASPQVAQRLAALEKKAAEPAAAPAPESDPVRANAAAAENSKRIDALQAQLTAVGEMQTSVSSLTSDLAARLSRQPPIADVGERLVALEQQLSELGAAARSEPDRAGRIPQLAQMTGRIADLETALTTRVGEVRKDATREIETRLAPVTEASEATRSATQRIDREIGTLKSETNRLATGLEKVQTDTQRLQLALKAAGDETAKLGGALDTTRRDLETRIQSLAKPADLTAAVAPLSSKIGALEQSLTTVVKSEGERNATAERIVLSLELGNL
ncbi:MAG: hypothetical protein IT537_21020, partial [Hyphomicrobiales bacterium]|nr:hypothetical protein [Hyphomicrobiales bacterium]